MKLPARIIVPVLAALLVTSGLLFFLWWQVQGSVESFRGLLRQHPDLALPLPSLSDSAGEEDEVILHLRQGDLLALQGAWKDAEAAYERAVEQNGGVLALRKLIRAQLERRQTEKARATLARLREEAARAEDILLFEVLLELQLGNPEKSRTLLETAPDSPPKHYGLALLSIVQGQHEEAKTALMQAEEDWDPVLRASSKVLLAAYDEYAEYPESREIHLQTLLARALAEVQECELALPLLSQVLTAQDDYRDAWIVQGYCELTTERTDQALASLERAYSLDPEKPETQYFLGRAYAASGDHRSAMTYLQYAVKNGFKDEKDVRGLLAEEAQQAGEFSVALKQYRILKDVPDAALEDAAAFVTASLAYGDKEEAYQAAAQAVAKWPGKAVALELLGTAALETGRMPEAKTALEKALEKDPSRQSAREKLLGL